MLEKINQYSESLDILLLKKKKVCFFKLNYCKIVLLQPKITNHSLSQGSLQPVCICTSHCSFSPEL